MKILVACPTRDRPEEFAKCAQSFVETTTSAQMVAYVDEDQREMYARLKLPPCVALRVGPRLPISEAINLIAREYPYDVMGVCADDTVFVTPAWEGYVEEVFKEWKDGIGVLSPAHNGGRFVNFPFLSRTWIETVGWFCYPEMFHFCWDTVIELLGDGTRIKWAPRERFLIHHNAMMPEDIGMLDSDARAFLQWAIRSRRSTLDSLQEKMHA